MRIFRQLGTWGTAVALAPILWVLACALAWGLAQKAYANGIVPQTRAFRASAGPQVQALASLAPLPPIKDPLVLVELQKYLQVWSLEPGACLQFPVAGRFPWCWNPFRASALILRLKQKQAFLRTQRHEVQRLLVGPGRERFYLAPDPQAALGGRRFLVEAEGTRLVKAVEL